jgi:di/tricarboxylate transporter
VNGTNAGMLTVFGILGVAGVLFASGRVRLDIVALLSVLALMLTGILTPREALAGFGDPVVLLVAALLVVGESLTRTGVAHAIGLWLMRSAGTSETRLLILLMGSAAILSGVMSSTAVVAIFIPVVLTLSAKSDFNASRLLMPLSFAALIGGMLTLIATTPNLVVSSELARQGHEPLAFFSFLPVGLAVLVVGMLYVLLVGRRLLPGGEKKAPTSEARTMDDLARGFEILDQRHRLRVPPGSSLAGRTLAEARLGDRGIRVVGIERRQRFGIAFLPTPNAQLEIREGDILALMARREDVAGLTEAAGLEPLGLSERELERWREAFGAAVVLIHPESKLIGHSLRESEFRSRHGLHVMGIRRSGEVLEDFEDEPLASSDSLLVAGPWKQIGLLQAEAHDFVVLALPVELDEVAPERSRAPLALLILLGMVLLSAFEIVPMVAAVMMAALAVVFARCLTMEDGYRSIHWSSLVLIAGMLPIATALKTTGGVDVLVGALAAGAGEAGPYAMMAVIFLVTATLGLVLSNTATAVIMAPIAIGAAEMLSVSPRPFAMVVAIAASAAFITPVSTPVVTLIVEPGSYRFADFVKVGAPLLLLVCATTIWIVPWFFPL